VNKQSAINAAEPDILMRPSDCRLLAEHAIKMANSWFIAMCPGPRELMGTPECNCSLVEDINTREFLIDLVIFDLAHEIIYVVNDDDSSDDSDSSNKT
jgi:hypothetical protein